MRNLEQITTHVEDGLDRLLQQFKNDKQLNAFLTLQLQRAQDFHNVVYGMIAARYLANAENWILEQWGAAVGEPRPEYGAAATDDDAYRTLIYGRIAINHSHGTIPDLLNILGVLGGTARRIYEDFGPSITVNLNQGDLLIACDCLRVILAQAKAPHGLNITAHTDTPFGFDDDPSAFGFDNGEIGEGI